MLTTSERTNNKKETKMSCSNFVEKEQHLIADIMVGKTMRESSL